MCVSQSSCFWSYTLVRMCTCISTWIHVHMTAHVYSIPMHSLMETWVPLYGSVFVSQSPHFCSHTLFQMCIWIVHVLMSIWLPILAWPPLHSYIETWVPHAAQCVCINHSTSGTCTYVYLTPHVHMLHHFSILWWKHGFFCAVLWVCWSHPIPWLECVHASVQDLCQHDSPCLLTPYAQFHGNMGSSVWHSVCIAVIPLLLPHLGYNVYIAYIHVFMLKWIPMSPLIPMHSLMETWVPCMAQCMFPSNLISVAIPCLECVHASVHIFMSTQLPMLVQPPMHCYMETWIPLCGSVCVCPNHHTTGPIPWLKCIHASVHVYMSTWLTMSASLFWIVIWKPGCPCVVVCVCVSVCVAVILLWSHTLIKMCTCISTCTYVNLSSEFWYTHFA